MSVVVPFPRRRGAHPAGSRVDGPRPPVQVINGRVWAQGASVADVTAALAGWVELARLNPSGVSSDASVAVPDPRGDEAP